MSKTLHQRENALFRAQLRQTREAAGLTQSDLARAIGRTQVFVSHIERGVRRLDTVELLQICRAMGTELKAFSAEFQDAADALQNPSTPRATVTSRPRSRMT